MHDIDNHFSFRLFPGSCVLCGQSSLCAVDLCARCEADLPRLSNTCPSCAMPVHFNGTRCGRCIRKSPPQDACRAAFRYAYPLDALVQRYKFNGDHASGRVLGELFSRLAPGDERPDCLLPVPLHPRRLRERGFNQSEMLAQALGAKFGIAVRTDVIRRVRDTAVQSGMNAVARRRNVRGAFAVRAGEIPRRVVIVDDVITTGSTTGEIVRTLRRAGAKWLEVWALARAVAD